MYTVKKYKNENLLETMHYFRSLLVRSQIYINAYYAIINLAKVTFMTSTDKMNYDNLINKL